MSKTYNEDMFDLAIKHAGHSILEEMGSHSNTEGIQFPDSLEKKMRGIINRQIIKRKTRRFLIVASKVAAILLVFMIVSTAVIYSSDALRSQVINMFIDKNEDAADINFYNIDKSMIPGGMVIPKFIPNGFELVDASYDGAQFYTSQYENDQGAMFRIDQVSYDACISLTNQLGDSHVTTIMGRDVYVLEQGDSNVVIFNDDVFGFIISGEIELTTLLIVTESLLG